MHILFESIQDISDNFSALNSDKRTETVHREESDDEEEEAGKNEV